MRGRAPSGTSVRFLILVIAVIATSAVIFLTAYNAVPGHLRVQGDALMHCAKTLHHVGSEESTLLAELTRQSGIVSDFQSCMAPVYEDTITWTGGGLVIEFAVLMVLYLWHPVWLRRRGRVVPLGDLAGPELTGELAVLVDTAGLSRPPRWVVAPYAYAQGAQAFGLPGRHQVQLDLGLLPLFDTDRSRFRAKLLHELAHLRNRDVGVTYLTTAAWQAFVIVALIPAVLIAVVANAWLWPLGTVLALAVLVFLARNAVLRVRERHADAAAAELDGSPEAVLAAVDALPWPPRPTRWSRWTARFGTHPHPDCRRAALNRPLDLLRTGPLAVVTFGLTAGIATSNLVFPAQVALSVAFPARMAVGATLGTLAACAVVGATLALFLSATGRQAVVRTGSGRPGAWARWGLPALLGLAFSAGMSISVVDTVAGRVLEPVATALLCLGLCLCNAWFLSVYGAAVAPQSPRWVTASLTGAFSVVLVLAFFYWYVSAASPPSFTAFLFGRAPDPGASIGWYRELARWTTSVYEPINLLANFPIVLVLILTGLLPLAVLRAAGTSSSAARRAPAAQALLTATIAGAAAVLLAGVALPLAARATLPVEVRQTTREFVLGGVPFYDAVALYTYLAVAVLAAVVAAAVVAFRSPRLRPVLVPTAMTFTCLIAAAGVYVMSTFTRCANIREVAHPRCMIKAVPFQDHVFYLDTMLAWSSLLAIPVALVAAAAGARRRSGDRTPDRGDGRRLRWPVLLALAGLAIVGAELTVFSRLINPTAIAATADNDPCLIGFWVEESRRTTRPINEQAQAEFAASGVVHAFNRDGTAATFYGAETVERAAVDGQTYELHISGAIRWRYTALDGTLSLTEPRAAASAFVSVGADRSNPFPVTPGSAGHHMLPPAYTCDRDTATASGPGRSVSLRRIGSPPR